ncbi:MAG: HEPN domain-containing protein, partial [Candidatus Aenigmarchaeota archaeon]|nr:HEPN domain-containing protein [Candidatus Aenigmarchaeota archaeon]
MRIEKELLEIAKKDLESAKILYKNNLYPQAVFFFQQSVEKANKALGLMLKLVKEDELKNYIRHKPIKIYGRIFRNKLREIE